MNSIIGKPTPAPAALWLPLFTAQVPAGFPSPAMDCLHNPVDLHERLIHNTEATFFVRVCGDSMRDAGIVDGAILIVDTSRQPCDGDIVVANIDEQYTVKRLRKVRGRFELHPENTLARYPILRPTTELQIFGVVTSHIVEHLKKPVKG